MSDRVIHNYDLLKGVIVTVILRPSTLFCENIVILKYTYTNGHYFHGNHLQRVQSILEDDLNAVKSTLAGLL